MPTCILNGQRISSKLRLERNVGMNHRKYSDLDGM